MEGGLGGGVGMNGLRGLCGFFEGRVGEIGILDGPWFGFVGYFLGSEFRTSIPKDSSFQDYLASRLFGGKGTVGCLPFALFFVHEGILISLNWECVFAEELPRCWYRRAFASFF